MKTAILAALASAAAAVEVQPAPGTDLDPTRFTDVRLLLGVATPISTASRDGVDYESDQGLSPRVAVQLVHGQAGYSLGAAIGIELAWDQHRGDLADSSPAQSDARDPELRVLSLGLNPKLVMRPDYDDPIDWAPGRMHVELGPVLAVGMGTASVGSSGSVDSDLVVRYGVRLDLVWTDADALWQGGLGISWERLQTDIDGGDIAGDGVAGALILGHRL